MNQRDKANYEYLRKVLNECWGFSKKSLDWFNSVFDDPSKREIDPIYKKIIGEDLRARWKLSDYSTGENKEENEFSWSLFNRFFYAAVSNLGISYSDFINNLKLVGKQNVKLNKILSEYYLKPATIENGHLFYDILKSFNEIQFAEKAVKKFSPAFNNIGLINNFYQTKEKIKSINKEDYEQLVASHILISNEIIGKYKKPVDLNGYELVLSLNWVDWLLCSTAESWRSCWNIESETGFWTGIPFLFDDRNRSMLYVTNVKQNGFKKYREFETEHLITRSWALLSKKDTIHPVRWFPGNGSNPSGLDGLTKLPFTNDYRGFESKYPFLEKIRFEDDKSWIVPYLDTFGLYKNESGIFSYSKDRGAGGGNGNIQNMWYANRDNGKHLFDLGLSLYEKINFVRCNHCNKKINKRESSFTTAIRIGQNEFVCKECHTEFYSNCELCVSSHLKTDLIKVEGQYGHICEKCFSEKFVTCSICKKPHLKEKTKNGICNNCQLTSDLVVQCKSCGEIHIKSENLKTIIFSKELTHYFCNDECIETYLNVLQQNDINMFNEIKKCSSCGDYYHINLMSIDIKKLSKFKIIKNEIDQEFLNKKINIPFYDYGDRYCCNSCNEAISVKKQRFFSFEERAKAKRAASVIAG